MCLLIFSYLSDINLFVLNMLTLQTNPSSCNFKNRYFADFSYKQLSLSFSNQGIPVIWAGNIFDKFDTHALIDCFSVVFDAMNMCLQLFQITLIVVFNTIWFDMPLFLLRIQTVRDTKLWKWLGCFSITIQPNATLFVKVNVRVYATLVFSATFSEISYFRFSPLFALHLKMQV